MGETDRETDRETETGHDQTGEGRAGQDITEKNRQTGRQADS